MDRGRRRRSVGNFDGRERKRRREAFDPSLFLACIGTFVGSMDGRDRASLRATCRTARAAVDAEFPISWHIRTERSREDSVVSDPFSGNAVWDARTRPRFRLVVDGGTDARRMAYGGHLFGAMLVVSRAKAGELETVRFENINFRMLPTDGSFVVTRSYHLRSPEFHTPVAVGSLTFVGCIGAGLAMAYFGTCENIEFTGCSPATIEDIAHVRRLGARRISFEGTIRFGALEMLRETGRAADVRVSNVRVVACEGGERKRAELAGEIPETQTMSRTQLYRQVT